MAHITVYMTLTEYAYQYRPDHEFAQDPLIAGVHFDAQAKQPSTTAFTIPISPPLVQPKFACMGYSSNPSVVHNFIHPM